MDEETTHQERTPEGVLEIPLLPCAESSQIARIGYDPATGDLVVEFKNGGARYHYLDVSYDVGMKLQHIPAKGEKFSLGSYFYQVIKAHPEVYPYQRIAETVPLSLAAVEPECLCGQDAALARGETSWLRLDLVCPKHDAYMQMSMDNERGL